MEPITREEMLMTGVQLEPITRKELFLAKAAGMDVQTPEPITREEMFLSMIVPGGGGENGGEGEGGEPAEDLTQYITQIYEALEAKGYMKAEKYSWEGVFQSIDAGTYATDYAIGDMIPLDLGSEGIINMQIAAFDAEDLADGSAPKGG